ncbi:hypothetical protein SAMN06265360_10969 [Haloechinothrix alba]|uniref:Magnesium transporter NIPA n=1 Tax=Haloechinothrix alba TaxID=664784 RepID=A0A238X5V1_9PSEU|nr:DMT family transporter [Haloechinothrix alba]SNR53933.1 hypothetical protein SAMN06265360_10969 [Haloechinothrix alba]
MIAVGIALAVLGALCFATAAEMQHNAVRTVGAGGLQLRRAGLLARDPTWLSGLLALAAGAGLHTLALAFAPLAVAQPIGVLALVASVLLAACRQRRTIRGGELSALALTVAGVTGFVLLAMPAAGTMPDVDGGTVLRACVVIAVLVTALVPLGRSGRRIGRCLAFATAAAACYALVSVLTRIATVQLRTGGWSWDLLGSAAGVVLAAALGGWLIQHAYAGGSPDLVLACLTVGDPVVAVGVGMTVLGEAVPAGAIPAAAQAVCAAVAVTGVAVLAAHRSTDTLLEDDHRTGAWLRPQ